MPRPRGAIPFVNQEPLRLQLDRQRDGLCLAVVENVEKWDGAGRAHPQPIGRTLGEPPQAGRCIRVRHLPQDSRWHKNLALKRRQNLQPTYDVQVVNGPSVGDHPDHGRPLRSLS